MLDYVRQRPSPTRSHSSCSFFSLISLIKLLMYFQFLTSLCFHGTEAKLIETPASLQTLLKLRTTPVNLDTTKRALRIIYFREFDKSIDEHRLKFDVKNLTDVHGIDFKLNILDQSHSFSMHQLCAIIGQERRDTILVADLYTKEIDFISRALKIPTIAITNRYQIVQGKEHNPYLFKLMPDAVEEAKSVAYTLDTRSVYTRIALIYDTSLDMVEYRLAYLRLAKQHVVYRAHLPRIAFNDELRRSARMIIHDLLQLNVDLIFCMMSTERELLFVRLIKELGSFWPSQHLLNRTSWWFASRLGETHGLNYFPKIFTATEDRRRTLSHFSSTSMKMLLNAVLKTYLRLPPSSTSNLIGPSNCDMSWHGEQLRRTQMFINLFTNFTEWNCEIRVGSGVDPILFNPDTLTWRVPTMFMVHTEHQCQGMLTRTFYSVNSNADQFFRSCRSIAYAPRKSSSNQPDNSTTTSSNALVDINLYHQMFGKLWNEGATECRMVSIRAPLPTPYVVGVVEPPYIFVSDAQISSEFHCNHGIPCYQIDPPVGNASIDPLIFHSKTSIAPHCCYGISINLLLRMEDSNLVSTLKTMKLFVFSDKPNKWLALTQAVQNRRAHLSISAIPSESFLARSIELSPAFYHSSYVILTAPEPSGPSVGAFLQPFSWTTWCMIFFVLNAVALFETYFEWHSPYGLTPRGRRRDKVFSFASALTLSWSIIFSHTFKTKSPKCWSNRFLGNVWGGFGIVFIAIYTAKLAAFMVEIVETQTVANVHGIIEECSKLPRCTIGVVPNTSDEEYLKRFFTLTLYTHIQYVPSYTQGIDLLRSHAITYLLMDHSMARYYLTRDVLKLMRISGDNFGTFGLSLGFSKFDTDLKNNITDILLYYVDKGIIQRLHDEWYVYENCEFKRLNQDRMLSVDRFIGVFILLAAGMIVGFITLILEWITFKYAVPYWRRKQWPGWMFCSQRLYSVLNASDDIFNEVYHSSKTHSFRCVGERLHNYSTRSDSLDLRVVDVPKLICTTYQLKEQMNKIREEQEQQTTPFITSNGDISGQQQLVLRNRIDQLEEELTHLRLQLSKLEHP